MLDLTQCLFRLIAATTDGQRMRQRRKRRNHPSRELRGLPQRSDSVFVAGLLLQCQASPQIGPSDLSAYIELRCSDG
jgi:hypothetical protein